MSNRPKVGVGVIVIKDGKVLMGKRKGSHGEGYWHFTGGHLELNESIEECAKRETLEEADIEIGDVKSAIFTNDIFEKEDKHYVTLFVTAKYISGEPKIMEPEKCEGWDWYDWNNLPSPLFLSVQNLLKQDYNPFTS